ncbi:MAG: Hydrolase, TatD family [candidate division CPR2 bacterium GW2011_GWC1_39_9]|uniref:Hydrolase, TatD family n=1 Tax=candidate division CPR2 bacterium GW2011_GWC2_39_10 TaxID=1618345 RepID=A0A0G0LPD2_UNCC2|nr:MAG: Hydrolase, TatD family [candidate division CPR2 bacterium GW2011_GWC2_39_10]KKR34426.1 MAG: Hydrolase, TatD family [candidate division CPR2 bacterium GW2011_GWC1_39_9]
MLSQLIDTHAHLDFPDLIGRIDKVLDNAQNTRVTKIINVGNNLVGSRKSVDLGKKYSQIYPSIGLHPHVLVEDNLFNEDKLIDNQIFEIKQLLGEEKVVAIGEIGLDYFRLPETPFDFAQGKVGEIDIKRAQKELFIRQLQLAAYDNMPVIIHSRDSADDTLKIMNEFSNLKAVFHCFSYSLEIAKEIINKGWLISFTANITYPNNKDGQEIIRYFDLSPIMIETDAPFLAPQGKRGTINEPANLLEVAKKIAEIKQIKLEEVADWTTKNAVNFFDLKN